MFEKEIDEIYELCKRVVNEVPAANVTFDFSGYGLEVRGVKRKEDVLLPKDKFKWDLYQNISFNSFSEKESRESLKAIKTFLLELLPSLEIAGCINELLRELQSRGDYILDYENCDMSLDHVEYHKAEDIDGEKFGDASDNLYCFFKAV